MKMLQGFSLQCLSNHLHHLMPVTGVRWCSTEFEQGQPAATLHDKRRTLSSFLSNDAVTKAEVLLALQIIAKHQSYRSCDKLKELFQEMFSDSDIAGKFILSPTKASYMIVYGLAPYFQFPYCIQFLSVRCQYM